MSVSKCLNTFFNKIECHYGDTVHRISHTIEHGELMDTEHEEINFVLKLIAKLRQDYEKNHVITRLMLEEILKGGHLKFQDDGTFYQELRDEFHHTIYNRNSSHKSCVPQYSFSGPIIKEILFGVSIDRNNKKTTWIQFEKHHTKSIVEFVLHIFDFFIHKWSGKNIGPFGSSHRTEDYPIVISKKP
ncbi:hypothetical protein [Legionella spiritensis]|uniref:Uncharacterized protein n=1 Tax=Legionella spiritensis TaxID=452 RepID=A0A0W0YW96_LEGSP|nr:hypothetical protein [Legionella spiritensis]KTD61148.1 hypothetical protein Lspi_2768 [Legionella spiritensis]SNV45211.1 Uncharacterised protein [Legionella spiritensis]